MIAAAIATFTVAASPASAQITYKACAGSAEFACGHLTVPLDPSGVAPGAITLAIRRHRAPVGEARTAVIALAGGPGQPALPFAEQFVEALGPIAATRDVIAFDQRGVGLSHPLSCHAFEAARMFGSLGALVGACAAQIGPERTYYTTADSVADIEAIRQAGGYEKLVLYGTSYGTKVAEMYAQVHPERVEALVLDSVVTPTGPDTLERSTFAAIPRVLRGICAAGACRGITSDPVKDLARVLAGMRRGPLSAREVGGEGRAHPIQITAGGLFSFLIEGDLAPELRSEFVTAARSAATGDRAPLARLLVTTGEGGGDEVEDFDSPLYFATTCEEQQFPWNRASDTHDRLLETGAAARGLPARAFAPFGPATAIERGDFQACAAWPYTAPAPAPGSEAMPDVPALIISGADDLRTPTADARALAGAIPGSHLIVVPNTGHSVLSSEPGTCARDDLLAMFAGRAIRPCPSEPPPAGLLPPPLPPLHLSHVSPLPGYPARIGRTLHAVALSLVDLSRQLALRLALGGERLSALHVGGLRAGWAAFEEGRIGLHGFSYVPGLAITGSISAGAAVLRLTGGAGAGGTLRAGTHGNLAGTLEGHHVVLPATSLAVTAIVRADALASSKSAARGIAGARRAGRPGAPSLRGGGALVRQLP